MHKIILDVIDYVEDAGFILKSMVCDQGSSNQSAIKKLGITKYEPFIERHNRKIFFNPLKTRHNLAEISRNELCHPLHN